MATTRKERAISLVPDWVPIGAARYVAHVEAGCSIRSIARAAGCHASTVLRQVRRYETRRDDLLIDLALKRLGRVLDAEPFDYLTRGNDMLMTRITDANVNGLPDDAELKQTAPHILRRLNEQGACMAIAQDMDMAVVVRDGPDGQTLKTAVLDRRLAEAMAIKEWITLSSSGRIVRYKINASGRIALKTFMAEEEAARVGMGEGADPTSEKHRDWARRNAGDDTNARRGIRYGAAESPMLALSRRKDKDGSVFLSAELVAAGERLREDFELAQMGSHAAQNWDAFVAGASTVEYTSEDGGGSEKARGRVARALGDLGPGLGDVVLRCCCFLEGMEAVERRMGWSARSGKIVLRIALMRLKSHYDDNESNWSPMIG
ncbi:MAG: helix-turn-helix domain-containing protein [Silicimonas sp.]|nr:helix-turn-helix domain-containing protein [Silicimonas sp.]